MMSRETTSFIVGLVLVVGSLALMWLVPATQAPREALIGLITLVAGFYFGRNTVESPRAGGT